MLRILLLLVALGASLSTSSQAQTPEIRPRAGEIALEGRITSFDVVKNILKLRVVSFTNAAGKSAQLSLPKERILAAHTKTAVFKAQGKVASLGDLGKDEEIVAIGRDDGKQLRVRLIVWRAREGIKPDPDTPPVIAPFLPAPQGAFGVSLRPVDALWTPKDTLIDGSDNPMPSFLTRWKLSSETPKNNDQNDESGFYSTAQLINISGPKGEPLDRAGIYSPVVTPKPMETQFANKDIDPRWPFLTFEWELREPKISLADTGQFTSILEWDNLDFPKKVGEKIEVGQEKISSKGNKIRLINIERRVLSWKPTEEILSFNFRVSKISDPSDVQVSLDLNELRGEKTIYPQLMKTSGQSGDDHSIECDVLPPAGAGKLKLGVTVLESALSWQNRSKYKRVKFQIPVAAIWKARPLERKVSAPISAENAQLKVQMEGINLYRPSLSLRAVLWVENKERLIPREGDWTYLVKSGSFSNRSGQTVPLNLPISDENTRFVRENGEIAAPETRSQVLRTSFESTIDLDGPLEFSLNFERARRVRHYATFRDIPVPVSNQSRAVKTGEFADDFFEVRRVVRYVKGETVPGQTDRTKKNESSGVAIVIEFSPLFLAAQHDFRVLRAVDSEGRLWDYNTFDWSNGDPTNTADRNPRLRTLYLPGFGAKTAKVSLDLMALEMQWEGTVEQTLKFRVP